MTMVQHKASLSEGSVQAIARGDVSKKARGRGPQRNPSTVIASTSTTWHPLFQLLVKNNGIDPLCIETLSPTEFLIHNTRGPWK